MHLSRDMSRQGSFLFRWRSYLPLLLLPFALVVFPDSSRLEAAGYEWADTAFETFCFLLSLSGLVMRCLTVGHTPARTSGRGVRIEAARLNTTGAYSVVRHPLYFGNFLVGLGLVLFLQSGWFALVYLLAFMIYYERIMCAEEENLRSRFGVDFEAWAEKTPAFVPRLRNWVRPPLPFSWRAVLRREYTTLLLICVAFPALDGADDVLLHNAPLDTGWLLVLGFGASVYACLHFLKTKTSLLAAPGR